MIFLGYNKEPLSFTKTANRIKTDPEDAVRKKKIEILEEKRASDKENAEIWEKNYD